MNRLLYISASEPLCLEAFGIFMRQIVEDKERYANDNRKIAFR